ncbi:MAG: hypothetical protein HWN66_15510 [Candidatus Helarchaeota archaeon]|nr:hypothetical protein [Candidatus Helarchaeota archaeon]
MENAWFALYHVYSTAKKYDAQGLQNFEKDIKFAQEIGVKTLILEDYYSDFVWGEYTNFWNVRTFRKMIQITKNYGIRFIPYLDVTELATHGAIYKKNGKAWGAKNHWGKPYSAFSSIFLPYYDKFDFHTKLMCPASGWFDYFTDQARILLTEYEVNGIYLDRVDYRVRCYDHSRDPDHFIQGLPALVKSIQHEVKSVSSKNLLILNDSCVDPDPPLINCMKSVDYVLTELLPVDTDPRNFYWQVLVKWGDLIYALRHLLKPLFKLFMNFAFTTGGMTDERRIQQIINRLRPHVGHNIFVFSHRKDYEGIRAIRHIAQKNQLACSYVSGLRYLRDMKELFDSEN